MNDSPAHSNTAPAASPSLTKASQMSSSAEDWTEGEKLKRHKTSFLQEIVEGDLIFFVSNGINIED